MGVVVLVLVAIGTLTACAPTTAPPAPIIFGSEDSPESTFRLDEEVAWTTRLPKRVDETSINLVISPRGSDTELFGYRQFITDPEGTRVDNQMPLGRFLPDPGIYVMRYISNDGDLLAEGEFELVADSN